MRNRVLRDCCALLSKLNKSLEIGHFTERPRERAHILSTNAFNKKAQDLFCRNESRQRWPEARLQIESDFLSEELVYQNVDDT